MKNKYLSRKFLLSLSADILGVISLIASEDGNDLQILASISLIAISTIVYVVAEAKVDSAHVATNVANKLGMALEEISVLVDKMQTNDDPLISSVHTTESKEDVAGEEKE